MSEKGGVGKTRYVHVRQGGVVRSVSTLFLQNLFPLTVHTAAAFCAGGGLSEADNFGE